MFAYALAILMAFSVLLPINATRRCFMAVVKAFTLVVVTYLVNVLIEYCCQAFLPAFTISALFSVSISLVSVAANYFISVFAFLANQWQLLVLEALLLLAICVRQVLTLSALLTDLAVSVLLTVSIYSLSLVANTVVLIMGFLVNKWHHLVLHSCYTIATAVRQLLVDLAYHSHTSITLTILRFLLTSPSTSFVFVWVDTYTDRVLSDGSRKEGVRLLALHTLHLGVWVGLRHADLEVTCYGLFYVTICMVCYIKALASIAWDARAGITVRVPTMPEMFPCMSGVCLPPATRSASEQSFLSYLVGAILMDLSERFNEGFKAIVSGAVTLLSSPLADLFLDVDVSPHALLSLAWIYCATTWSPACRRSMHTCYTNGAAT